MNRETRLDQLVDGVDDYDKKIFKKLTKYMIDYGMLNESEMDKILLDGIMKNHCIGDHSFVEELLTIIYDFGYRFTESNYGHILNSPIYHDFKFKFNNNKIFEDLKINNNMILKIQSYSQLTYMDCIPYDFIDMVKNGKYFLMKVKRYIDCIRLVNTYGINVTQEIIDHRSLFSYHDKINNYLRSKLTNKNELPGEDADFIKCKNVEEIDDFIKINKYKVSGKTFSMACQYYMDISIISNILGYKIKFSEEEVNTILLDHHNNYDGVDNTYLYDIWFLILSSGYEFTQKNYIEIAKSKICNELFCDKNLISNIIFDDIMLFTIVNNRTIHNAHDIIDNLMSINPENKENITAFCFGFNNKTSMKKLIKKYNLNVTPKCIKCSLIAENFTDLVKIFADCNVKPDVDTLKTFIEVTCPFTKAKSLKYKNAMLSLL